MIRKPSRRSSAVATDGSNVHATVTVAVLLLLAQPALASGVGLALNLPDANPVHRDFAAGIVADAYGRWDMLSPQLSPDEVERCQAEERCLLQVARGRDASHLLIVGVAGLGATDFVVSVKLLETAGGRELASYSDLGTPGKDPRQAGADVARKTFTRVSGVPAAPQIASPELDPDPGAQVAWDGLSPLALTGWGIAGAGAVMSVGAAAVGGAATVDPALVGGREQLASFVGVGAPVCASVIAVGLGVVAVDAFLPREAPPPPSP